MKRSFSLVAIAAIALLTSCGGGKDSAKSIAQEWCDLNGKVQKAEEGEAKEKAKEARRNFEKELEAKYKKDDPFFMEIGREVEKCETASERE